MKLTNISEVREIMERNGLRFNKQFGQNFLINEAVPRRIAEECGAKPEDGILEIGPGIGTLTRELAARYRKVVAVEIDRNLIPVLGQTLADFDNVTVINDDVMKTDLKALLDEHFPGMRVTVCANLPYYITTPILMKLLESDVFFDNITVMVQKEVAVRLTSLPGSAEYGSITASVGWYGKAEKLFGVSAGSFLPAPKVDSAVVRLSLYGKPPYPVRDEALLFRVIRAAFGQRRKTLLNSMTSFFPELTKNALEEAIVTAGFSAGIRGETLSTEDFAKLTESLYDRLGKPNENENNTERNE